MFASDTSLFLVTDDVDVLLVSKLNSDLIKIQDGPINGRCVLTPAQ